MRRREGEIETDCDVEGVRDAVQSRAVGEAPEKENKNTKTLFKSRTINREMEREREENLAVSKHVVRGEGTANVALPTPHEKQDVGISTGESRKNKKSETERLTLKNK